MLLYVAGPYSALTEEGIQANIKIASDVAAKLWRMGHAVICPHKNGADFHNQVPELSFDDWLKGDMQMIAVCDGIVFLPGWEFSRGSLVEMGYAEQLKIPFWIYPDLPELHPTEVGSPVQVKAFREEMGIMMRTHLDKNADYSPVNIAGPGWAGIVTRLWDKQTRLMNLTGFKVILGEMSWLDRILSWLRGDKNAVVIKAIIEQPNKIPKNESVEDTLTDEAVYSVIGKLFRRNQWGK